MPYYGGTPMAADPKFLMDRLMKNGMTRMQAAAVLGNLQRESGLASNNMNKDEGAYGLMQWRGPRFEALQQFAAMKGTAWTDPGTQADFIAHEMGGTERKNAQGFLQAKTIDEASAALKPVIRYGDKSGPERAMHARNFFGAADPVASEAGAAPSSGPAVLPGSPPTAQPAVSRETPDQRYYRMAYEDQAYRPPAKGLRGGIQSIGEALGAYARNPQRAQANMQANTARIGNALGLGGGAPAAQTPSGVDLRAPDANPAYLGGRDSLAGTLAGPAPTDLTSHTPIASAPPGAPESPRFPGGIPQPRPRPLTGPSLPPDDRLLGGGPTVAEMGMGSVVDPRGWDYG